MEFTQFLGSPRVSIVREVLWLIQSFEQVSDLVKVISNDVIVCLLDQ